MYYGIGGGQGVMANYVSEGNTILNDWHGI